MSIISSLSKMDSGQRLPQQMVFENEDLVRKICQLVLNPQLFLVNKTFAGVYKSDLFYNHILKQLRNLNFRNTLEEIFCFPQNATSMQKVALIIKVIQDYTGKKVTHIVNDFKDFYFTNILIFYKSVPGCVQLLESEDFRPLPDNEKVSRLDGCLLNLENDLNGITCLLKLEKPLAFIPRWQIEQFPYLRTRFHLKNKDEESKKPSNFFRRLWNIFF